MQAQSIADRRSLRLLFGALVPVLGKVELAPEKLIVSFSILSLELVLEKL